MYTVNIICLVLLITIVCPLILATLYDIIIERVEIIPGLEKNLCDITNLTITKLNKKDLVVDAVVKILDHFPDPFTVSFIAMQKTGNGFVESAFQIIDIDACEIFHKDKTVVPSLLNHSDLPKDKCPFPPGEYHVKNFIIDSENFPSAIPNVRNWRTDLIYKDKLTKQEVCGLAFYITIDYSRALRDGLQRIYKL